MTFSIVRFIQGIASSFYIAPALAMLSDIAPDDKRGKFSSIYFGSDFLGYGIGPIVGGLISERGGLRSAFLLLSLLCGLALILSRLMINETRSMSHGDSSHHSVRVSSALRDPKILFVGCTAFSALFIASGIRNTAIPLVGQLQGLGVSEIGIVLAIGSLVNAFVLVGGQDFVDKLGRRYVLMMAFASTAIVVSLFPLALGFLALALMTGMMNLTTSLITPAQSAIVMDAAHPRQKAISFGIFRTFADAGVLVGPIVVGYLADASGFAFPFYAAAALCVLTLVLAYVVRTID